MSVRKKEARRPVIGWREWAALPELGVEAIKAKVDTGARTSALHAFDLEGFERRGRRMVRFGLRPVQRRAEPELRAEAEVVGTRRVRNPGGRREERPVIRTEVRVGTERWPIEVTLTDRDVMGFRFLLGRTAVRRRFVVDPGRSYLLGEPRAPAPDADAEEPR